MERKEWIKCNHCNPSFYMANVSNQAFTLSLIYCITWMTVVSVFLLLRGVVVIVITVRDLG